MAVATLALWILALWFSNQLSPYVQRIDALESQSKIHQEYTANFEVKFDKLNDNVYTIGQDVSFIRGKLSK